MIQSLIIIFIFFSINAFSKNTLIYIGASDDTVNQRVPDFNESAKQVAEFYQKNKENYQATIIFGGANKESDLLIQKEFNGADILKGGLTQKNIDIVIEDLIKKLKQKPSPFKENDKILLVINTHGIEAFGPERTHYIHLNDSNYNLDKFHKLVIASEKAGIKLGIIDQSCYSGNTLNLATDKTCIISGSMSNLLSYNITSLFLNHQMEAGVSLEKIFLNSYRDILILTFANEERMSSGSHFLPMISTPEGKKISEVIDLISSELIELDQDDGTGKPNREKVLSSQHFFDQDLFCKNKLDFENFNYILNFINDQEKISLRLFNKVFSYRIPIYDFSSLKELLKKYRDTKASYAIKLKNLVEMSEILNLKEVTDILATDYQPLILKMEESIKKKPKDNEAIEFLGQLHFYNQGKADLIAKYPEAKKYVSIVEAMNKDQVLTFSYGRKIRNELTKFYKAYYEYLFDEKKSNACREFIL